MDISLLVMDKTPLSSSRPILGGFFQNLKAFCTNENGFRPDGTLHPKTTLHFKIL